MTKKCLSQHESELADYKWQKHELSSTMQELQTQNAELQQLLATARAKNEELCRIRREIETVLVEQEKQVTTFEEQIRQVTTERNDEVELARQRNAEMEQAISSLREDRQNQQKKIDELNRLIRQLRDQLEQEKCTSIMRDDSSRSAMHNRDEMIAKLKALLRENQLTAEQLTEEMQRMNKEAGDKNRTIAMLRARCDEMEAALCRSSLDGNDQFHDDVRVRQSSGKAGSARSEELVELLRHAQDDEDGEQTADPWRQRHISATATLVSASSDRSSFVSDISSVFPPDHLPIDSNFPQSRNAGNPGMPADDGGLARKEPEASSAEALYVTRQQLLRQVCF